MLHWTIYRFRSKRLLLPVSRAPNEILNETLSETQSESLSKSLSGSLEVAFHAVMDCSDEERIGKWGPNETKVNKLVGKRSNSHRKIMQKYKIQFL